MDDPVIAFWVLLASYLLGSIPFGLLLTRLSGTRDLRTIGSGNIGATNVLRTGRKDLAFLTLLFDAAKGAAAVFLVTSYEPKLVPLAGAGVLIGHIFPLWLRFRGGKGIATYLGVALASYWPCGLVFAAVWIVLTVATRISSVGGIGAVMATPVAAAIFSKADLAILYLAFASIVLWMHRANIGRLLAGTEPRIGAA